MSMVADMAGATALASPAPPACGTADPRKGVATQPETDAGNLFGSQLTAALAGAAESTALGADLPKRAAPKVTPSTDCVDGDVTAAPDALEHAHEPPAVAFVLTPWLAVTPAPAPAVEFSAPGDSKRTGKKQDRAEEDGSVTGDDASFAAISPDPASVPAPILTTPAVTIAQVVPRSTGASAAPPLVDAPRPSPTGSHDPHVTPAGREAVAPPVFAGMAAPPAATAPAPETAGANDTAQTGGSEDVTVTPIDPKPEGVPARAPLQTLPDTSSNRAQGDGGGAWQNRSVVAEMRAVAASGESAADARPGRLVKGAAPDTAAAHKVQTAMMPAGTPAQPVTKASGERPAADNESRFHSGSRAQADPTQPAGLPFAAAPVPAPHEPAPLSSSPAAIHHVSMPVVTPASVPAIHQAAWTPSPAVAESSADVPSADTPDRLVQSLRMQFLRGGGDAVVQLRPEHLGPVTVSLKVEQGGVSARIVTADPVVAEWLEAHQHTLREGLQSNGLSLDRLVIDREGRSPDRRERRETPARQRPRNPAERQSTFEVTL